MEQEWWGSWITSYKVFEKERKTRGAPRSKPKKKQKVVSLKKLERTQRIRGERFERVVYDPKTCWKVRGYFRLNEHACFLWHSPKIMYICGKLNFTICMYTIFPISMQKTVRPQIGPVKKNSQMETYFWGFFELVFFSCQKGGYTAWRGGGKKLLIRKVWNHSFLLYKTLCKKL